MKDKPLKFPTKDLAKPVTEAVVIRSPTKKLSSKERRKLRNIAYHQIKTNSPGASKGLVKQAAFIRSKKAFEQMEQLQQCGHCGNTYLKSNFEGHQCLSKTTE